MDSNHSTYIHTYCGIVCLHVMQLKYAYPPNSAIIVYYSLSFYHDTNPVIECIPNEPAQGGYGGRRKVKYSE